MHRKNDSRRNAMIDSYANVGPGKNNNKRHNLIDRDSRLKRSRKDTNQKSYEDDIDGDENNNSQQADDMSEYVSDDDEYIESNQEDDEDGYENVDDSEDGELILDDASDHSLRSNEEESDAEYGPIHDYEDKAFEEWRLDEREDDFNISPLIQSLVYRQLNDNLPEDSIHPLYAGGETKKGEFAEDFNTHLKNFNCTNEEHKSFLTLLAKHFTNSNLPISTTRNGNLISLVKDYIRSEKAANHLSFDCCRNGCVVFVGDQKEEIFCKECGLERYRKCTKSRCARRTYDQCNHSDRVVYKTIQYRPLLLVIANLLKTEGFITALKYEREEEEGVYNDLMDGQVPKQHLQEMEIKANEYDFDNDRITVHINLIMSEFYDGASPYTSKVTSFWPLLISILNLPPLFRTNIGIGMFLVSLFTGQANSEAERFLLRDCLVEELILLDKGYEITIADVTYFIQARLILHLFDTKGAEHVLRQQCSNSKHGCLYGCPIRGVYKKDLKSTVYIGHRKLLELRHYLRCKGQSRQCCPCKPIAGQVIPLICTDTFKVEGLRSDQPKAIFDLKCCDEDNQERIQKFLLDKNTQYKWYHKSVSPVFIRKAIYFHHVDYSPYIPPKRMPSQTYLDNAYEAELINGRRGVTTRKKSKPYNGTIGACEYKALRYYDHSKHSNADPFHALNNVAIGTFLVVQGKRGKKASTVRFCRLTHCHPSLYRLKQNTANKTNIDKKKKRQSKKGKTAKQKTGDTNMPDWELPEKAFEVAEEWLNCITVPKGYAKEFTILNVFSHPKVLKSISRIYLVSVLMDFLILAFLSVYKKYRIEYQIYLSLLSEDFSDLLSPYFVKDEINLLYKKVVETVCLHEAIFPISESTITHHQLVDLPHYIKLFGPIRCWWTTGGERCISEIKKSVTRGGRNSQLTITRRHIAREDNKCKEAYDFTIHNIYTRKYKHRRYQATMFNDRWMNLNKNKTALYACSKKCSLFKSIPILDTYRFTSHEYDQLNKAYLLEIEKYCESLDEALTLSYVYRLNYSYQKQKKNKSTNCKTFRLWLKNWDNIIKNETIADYDEVISILDVNNEEIFMKISEEDCLFIEDIENGVKHLLNFPFKRLYRNATVFGTVLMSRGWDFKETGIVRKSETYGGPIQTIPCKDANLLLETWFLPSFNSSLCKLKIRDPKQPTYGYDKDYYKDHYANINFFFRISMPGDPTLDNLPMASVVCRNLVPKRPIEDGELCIRDRYSYITFEEAKSYNCSHSFIPLTNMYSTPVATVPFKLDGQPLSKTLHRSNSINGENELKEIMLIDIFRPKLKIEYQRKDHFIYTSGDNDLFQDIQKDILENRL